MLISLFSKKEKKETKKTLKFSISPLIIHIIIRSKAAIVLFKEKNYILHYSERAVKASLCEKNNNM